MGCFSEDCAHVELDFKRPAKYVFLLPTNMRRTPEDLSKFFKSSSIEIIFFGVQGGVLDEAPVKFAETGAIELKDLDIEAVYFEVDGKREKQTKFAIAEISERHFVLKQPSRKVDKVVIEFANSSRDTVAIQAIHSRRDDPKYTKYLDYLNEYNDFYRNIVKNLTHSVLEERQKALKLLN